MHVDLAAQLSPDALKRLGGSDLEFDAAKLEQLAEVVLDEQEAVVRAHLSLHVAWSDALVGKTLRSSAPRVPETPTLSSPRHRIERRKVADLRPNRFNSVLFPDSLSEASIELLAEDLARNGQRVPGEVTPDGTIIDCERRWRAAKLLGWEEMDVSVVEGLTDDDVLDRILDACTSVRHLSVREQVNVYAAVHERLKREAGRQPGRPNQIIPKGIICLTPHSIKDAAARRAGFSSTTLAMRAEAVFSRGTEDLQAKVRDGSVTISAAYDELPKRSKSKAAPEEGASRGQPGEEHVEPPDEAVPSPSSQETVADPPSVRAAPDDAPLPDRHAEPAGQDTEQTTDSQADSEPDGTNDDDDDDDAEAKGEVEASDAAQLHPADPIENDGPDIGVHMDAVCHHLAQLAARDFGDAVCWFDQLVEEMRASLGDPPEAEPEAEGMDDLLNLLDG